jgi:hypothetical protein
LCRWPSHKNGAGGRALGPSWEVLRFGHVLSVETAPPAQPIVASGLFEPPQAVQFLYRWPCHKNGAGGRAVGPSWEVLRFGPELAVETAPPVQPIVASALTGPPRPCRSCVAGHVTRMAPKARHLGLLGRCCDLGLYWQLKPPPLPSRSYRALSKAPPRPRISCVAGRVTRMAPAAGQWGLPGRCCDLGLYWQ